MTSVTSLGFGVAATIDTFAERGTSGAMFLMSVSGMPLATSSGISIFSSTTCSLPPASRYRTTAAAGAPVSLAHHPAEFDV